jgi:RNA recognition motif-containing protein
MAKRIYVGNLSFDLTDEDLMQLFGQCGQVTEATIIKDKVTGRPKGFGFVEMPNDDEATHAIARLKGQDVKGRQIIVNEAEMRPVEGAVGSFPEKRKSQAAPRRAAGAPSRRNGGTKTPRSSGKGARRESGGAHRRSSSRSARPRRDSGGRGY